MANGKRSGTTSKSERRAREAQAEHDRQQARTPGTPQYKNRQRQLEDARMEEAIRLSSDDPITYNADDW
jgi:hypothetical protein